MIALGDILVIGNLLMIVLATISKLHERKPE